MTRRLIGVAVVISVVILLSGPAFAVPQLDIKDVLQLKRMGFSDAEIIAQLAKAPLATPATDADIKQLREAGAGDDLIKALLNPPRDLTFADVKAMLEAGQPTGKILDAIDNSPHKPVAQAGEALELRTKKYHAHQSIITALSGEKLTVAALRTLSEAQTSEASYRTLAHILGVARQEVAANDALALARTGVPADIIAQMKAAENPAPADAPAPAKADAEKKPAEPANPPTPPADLHPPDLIGSWEGDFAQIYGGIQHCRLALYGTGRYLLNISPGVVQQGSWSVSEKIFSFDPEPGTNERHEFRLEGNVLIIEGVTGTLRLVKR